MGDKNSDGDRGPDIDDSLDKLLQATLADFDRPNLLLSERKQQRDPRFSTGDAQKTTDGVSNGSSGPSSSSSSDKTKSSNTSKTAASHLDDSFLDETSKEIDEVLTSIALEDPGLAQQLRNLTDCAAGVSSSDHNEAMKSFSQFTALFKETLKSVSSQSGVPTEELLDEDLDDLMANLDKLAVGQTGNSDSHVSKSGSFDFSVPLNDVLKALLAKEVMYTSLQRCEEEFVPWLENNRTKLSATETKRYESQLTLVKNLLQEYGTQPTHGATDEHFRRLIVMITELQDLGAFPDELIAKVNTDAFILNFPSKSSTNTKSASNDSNLDPPDCKTS